MIIRTAIARSRTSFEMAKRVSASGCPGPAYVWAVRSIEVYIKEVMLLPLFLEELDGNWAGAWRKAQNTFGPSNWTKAGALVDKRFGPLEPMRTEEGANVWDVWKSVVVRRRGEIVHGKDDPSPEDAATVVLWAEQMMTRLPLRLIVAQKHPLHDLFVAALQRSKEMMAAGPDGEGQSP